jgi:hypothetical protein
MNEQSLAPIELEVIAFLQRVGAPNVPSQIAVYIHERRKDTINAIERLVTRGILYSEQDLTFFGSTGETTAFGLRNPN